MAEPIPFGIAGLVGWPVAHSPPRSTITGSTTTRSRQVCAAAGAAGKAVNCVAGTGSAWFPGMQRDNAAQAGGHADARPGRRARAPHRRRQYDCRREGWHTDGVQQRRQRLRSKPARRESRLAPRCGTDRRARRRWGRKSRRGKPCRQGAREIRLVNRTFERAQRIAKEFGPPVTAFPWEQRNDALADVALLANATNQGMAGKPALDIALDRLPRTHWSVI